MCSVLPLWTSLTLALFDVHTALALYRNSVSYGRVLHSSQSLLTNAFSGDKRKQTTQRQLL